MRPRVTPGEFMSHPAAAGASELVRGEIRAMTPASGPHGVIVGTLFAALNQFVETHQLGLCFPDNTGFQLPNLEDTVRSPDVAFIRADRLPQHGIARGWVPIAPDLVVEVLSPDETPAALEEKLRDYRTAGTRLLWVVDPTRRGVSIRRANGADQWVSEHETLIGEDELQGFSMPVARLFARLAPS
ncbi:MAG: Uma2 family endonuclease [bacterium]